MNICARFFLVLSLYFLHSLAVFSQDSLVLVRSTPRWYLGAMGGLSFLTHKTSLPVFGGTTDCGEFTGGKASGISGGITADWILLPDFLEISGRLLYSERPAQFTTSGDYGLQVLDENNAYVPFVRKHVFDARLTYLIFDVGFRIKPLEEIPLYIRISGDAGDPVFGATFEQTEEVSSPANVLFGDGTKKHSTGSGALLQAGTVYGAIGAIGADIPFQEKIFFTPEISYHYGLNNTLESSDWKTSALRVSLGVRYQFTSDEYRREMPPQKEPEKELEPPPPPKPVEKPIPPLVITSLNTTPLEIQETVVTQTFPLLPYIFFDSTSAVLRTRYIPKFTEKQVFSEENLPKEAIPTYYNVLPILAKRLANNPAIRVVITGTTDGRELPTAVQRKKLAEERARAVAEYWTKTWGISPEKISIQTRDIPELASSEKYAEGFEENRRAEFYSTSGEFLSPVVHSKFLEFTPIRAEQTFVVKTLNPEQADSWDLSVFHREKLLTTRSGKNAPNETLLLQITREIAAKFGESLSLTDSLSGVLQVKQRDGKTVPALCSFPIIKTRNKFELSRLSLIVFDFDRADITSQNKEMMKKFVNEALQPTSVSTITGSTDRLGEAEYNLQLSQARAEAVWNYLLELQPNANILSVKGVGKSVLPYNNDVPEGRYYCRTVSLEVKTPLK